MHFQEVCNIGSKWVTIVFVDFFLTAHMFLCHNYTVHLHSSLNKCPEESIQAYLHTALYLDVAISKSKIHSKKWCADNTLFPWNLGDVICYSFRTFFFPDFKTVSKVAKSLQNTASIWWMRNNCAISPINEILNLTFPIWVEL